MTHLDMHDAIDCLDAGLPDQPRLGAIVAGGRKRRRRTRTLWGAAGLATVAGVAQVAFLAGAQQAPATGTAAATSTGSSTGSIAESGIPLDLTAQVDAAVTAAVPGSTPPFRKPPSILTSYEFEGGDGVAVSMGRGADARFMTTSPCKVEQGCTQTQVGDLLVNVTDHWDDKDKYWARSVRVTPVEGVDGPAWTVIVHGGGTSAAGSLTNQTEADAALPSVETITDLAIELARLPLQ